MGDLSSIPGLGRSSGEGKSYPLQYSGLHNSVDCIVHVVTKSWILLSDFHFHMSLFGAEFAQFSSVQFSRSVMSDSLRPPELQHARPPCPSPTPEFTQTHVHRVGHAIQPSHPLSSPFPPAPNPFQHQSDHERLKYLFWI